MDARQTLDWLIFFWQRHKGFDANMTDLAKYCMVSRDTLYRWLNRKSLPKDIKSILIEEWLIRRDPKRQCLNEGSWESVSYSQS